MDIEKQVFRIFSSFIQDLTLTFPEIKNCLYRNYEDCILALNNENPSLKDYPKINSFLEKIQEYEKMISDKNPDFFKLEVEFLEEISFQRLWEKQISDSNRATLWKYLQTFTIININLKSSEELKNALDSIKEKDKLDKSDISDKNVAKDLKKLKKLSEEVQQEATEEDENELEEMLSGFMDSGIGDIAKEVAESMNINDLFGNVDENSNPMDIMQQMLNPEKMGQIFKNIGSVMEKKKESGDITEEMLKKDAEKMYGSMANNPMFSGMMETMKSVDRTNTTQTKNLSQTENTTTNKDPTPEKKELTREEKRKKLQEKLKEKEKNRTNGNKAK